MTVDAELRAIATRAADQYTDSVITSAGWTRDELIDAIQARLRRKHRAGRLSVPTTCPTPRKDPFPTKRAARAHSANYTPPAGRATPKRHLYPYRCPGCRQWHLTHLAPAEQPQRKARP